MNRIIMKNMLDNQKIIDADVTITSVTWGKYPQFNDYDMKPSTFIKKQQIDGCLYPDTDSMHDDKPLSGHSLFWDKGNSYMVRFVINKVLRSNDNA